MTAPAQEAAALTEKQRHVLEHTVGAKSREPFFRNHFVTGPECEDWQTLQELCALGLMVETRKPSELSGGYHVFAATEQGKEAIRELTGKP